MVTITFILSPVTFTVLKEIKLHTWTSNIMGTSQESKPEKAKFKTIMV